VASKEPMPSKAAQKATRDGRYALFSPPLFVSLCVKVQKDFCSMFCACETKILWLYEILIGLGCQQESELPWLAPKKGFKFNLSSLTNVIKDSAAANAVCIYTPHFILQTVKWYQ